MGEVDGVWGHQHDEAWEEFAGEVAAALLDDGVGIVELEVATEGDLLDGCRPWVAVSQHEGGCTAEIGGNDLLAQGYRLDEGQEQRLCEMGFREEVRDAEGKRWFAREGGPDDLDLLVGLAVRVLREVFGVVHPVFLEWDGRWTAPDGLDAAGATYPPRPRPAATAVWPAAADELSALVDEVVSDWLGHEPAKDDDGDIAIVRGRSMLFVRASPRTARVDLFSILVRDLRHRQAARREVNVLNRKSRGETYWVSEDRVMVRRCLTAAPFVAPQLVSLLEASLRDLDDTARDLAERVCGVRFLADDSEGVW